MQSRASLHIWIEPGRYHRKLNYCFQFAKYLEDIISLLYFTFPELSRSFLSQQLSKLSYVCLPQVLADAQHSKESFNNEQAELSERIQEYKRHIDHESRWPLCGSHNSSNGDISQPFPKSSHKEIKAVMQSAAEGKVYMLFSSLPSTWLPVFLYSLYYMCFIAELSIFN